MLIVLDIGRRSLHVQKHTCSNCGYPSASIIDSERVVFDIGGNKYRLVVKLWFPGQAVWINFVGTHKQYDRVDVKEL